MTPRPDAMRPRSRLRPDGVRPRPRPNDLASRSHGPRGLNIPAQSFVTGAPRDFTSGTEVDHSSHTPTMKNLP